MRELFPGLRGRSLRDGVKHLKDMPVIQFSDHPPELRVRKGVAAMVRHCSTDYDRLVREIGPGRAREAVRSHVGAILSRLADGRPVLIRIRRRKNYREEELALV